MSNSGEELKKLRDEIDSLDWEFIEVIAKRFQVVKEVGKLKQRHSLEVFHADRWDTIKERNKAMASENHISEALIADLFEVIHKHSMALQEDIT